VLVKEARNTSEANDFLKQVSDYATDRNIQNEIEVLRSRTIVGRTIQRLNFGTSYFLKGNVKTQELYKGSPVKVIIDTLKYLAYSTPLKSMWLMNLKFEISFHSKVTDAEFSETHRFGEKVNCALENSL